VTAGSTAQRSAPFHFVVSRGLRALFHGIAIRSGFLLTILKEVAGNIFLLAADIPRL